MPKVQPLPHQPPPCQPQPPPQQPPPCHPSPQPCQPPPPHQPPPQCPPARVEVAPAASARITAVSKMIRFIKFVPVNGIVTQNRALGKGIQTPKSEVRSLQSQADESACERVEAGL